MKLSPELEAACMALAVSIDGVPIHPTTTAPTTTRTRKKDLLPTVHIPPATWIVGLEVKSESNERGHWSRHHGRKAGQQRTVSEALGKHLRVLADYAEAFHRGDLLTIKLTRLGGRRMDRSNLANAFKGVEDTIALIIGANDGAGNWRCEFDQEPNVRVGIKIELLISTM